MIDSVVNVSIRSRRSGREERCCTGSDHSNRRVFQSAPSAEAGRNDSRWAVVGQWDVSIRSQRSGREERELGRE